MRQKTNHSHIRSHSLLSPSDSLSLSHSLCFKYVCPSNIDSRFLLLLLLRVVLSKLTLRLTSISRFFSLHLTMQFEVSVALNFLIAYLYNKLPRR
jgi:hypothetical protein